MRRIAGGAVLHRLPTRGSADLDPPVRHPRPAGGGMTVRQRTPMTDRRMIMLQVHRLLNAAGFTGIIGDATMIYSRGAALIVRPGREAA
jgi:hypothetical protein